MSLQKIVLESLQNYIAISVTFMIIVSIIYGIITASIDRIGVDDYMLLVVLVSFGALIWPILFLILLLLSIFLISKYFFYENPFSYNAERRDYRAIFRGWYKDKRRGEDKF